MGLRVMLVIEPQFRIGYSIRCRANVSADTSRIGLKRQYVQVAHHLHVLAAFFAFRNLDLDGRRIGGVTFARSDAGLFERGLFLAIFDSSDAPFHRADAVQVFIELRDPNLRCGPSNNSDTEFRMLRPMMPRSWSIRRNCPRNLRSGKTISAWAAIAEELVPSKLINA